MAKVDLKNQKLKSRLVAPKILSKPPSCKQNTKQKPEKSYRDSGIEVIGKLPWGAHFSQFYQTKEDLIDILIPYFKKGLENNEFCMWVTSEPLNKKEVIELLYSDQELKKYFDAGQIEVLSYTDWYLKDGAFEAKRVLTGWVDKLNRALEKGYEGLRLTGNTFWLEKENWHNFTDYEKTVNDVIGNYKMIANCTYSLKKCNASQIIDVVSNHQFALIKREGEWNLIESSDYKKTKESLKNERLKLIEERDRAQEAKKEISTSQRFLKIANEHIGFNLLLDEFVKQIGSLTSCEAIGIRLLDEEGNIPYTACLGFSQSFYEMESSLSIKSDKCMCINVVKGTTDPSLSYYSDYGSFYMNGTTKFLATVSEKEKGKTRNVCNTVGYESVALIPIQTNSDIVGLIHVADSKENMVPLKLVRQLERISKILGIAIQRAIAHDAINLESREIALANKILRVFFEQTSNVMYDNVLDVVLEGLVSKHGVFGYIDEQGDLICPTMTRMFDQCEMQNKCICYTRDKWKGLWSRALLEKRVLYTNQPPLVPKGHVPIKNNLASPILFHGEVIGLLSLANKDTDYTEDDRALIEGIANRIAPVLYAWIQKELRKTERKKTEKKFAHLASFPELNPNPIFEIDNKGKITYSNPASKKLFPDLSVKHPMLIGFNSVINSLGAKRNITTSRDIKFNDKFFQQTIYKNTDENMLRFYNFDITERKKAEEGLKKEKDFSNMLINSSNDGILAFDHDTRITAWNPGMENISGLSKEKVLGKKMLEDFPFLKRVGEDKLIFEVLAGKAVVSRGKSFSIPQTNKKGFFEAHYSPLHNAAGKTTGGLAIVRDVTERIKAEQELKKAYKIEHQIAETLQKSLLPVDIPKIKGLEVEYFYQSASKGAEVGGDFYDLFHVQDSCFGIVMGDVAGKGINAASETAKVKYLLRDRACFEHSPNEVLSSVNDALFKQSTNVFTALTYGVYDPKTSTLNLTNAGNPYPFLASKDRFLKITSTPVSIKLDIKYPQTKIKLNKGDILMMFTDGLVEARHKGELFGEERVRSFVLKNKGLSLNKLIRGLIEESRRFSHDNLTDDILVIGLKKA